MADRVSARITIGGVLPRSLLDELTRLIGDEDLRLDWDGEPFAPDAIPNDGPVELMAHEVAWGHFEHLERFCEDHTLAYVRWSGGCAGSFGPERVVFTGAGSRVSYAVTDDDDVVFDLETIHRLGSIAAIEAYTAQADFAPPALAIVEDIPGGFGEAGHG